MLNLITLTLLSYQSCRRARLTGEIHLRPMGASRHRRQEPDRSSTPAFASSTNNSVNRESSGAASSSSSSSSSSQVREEEEQDRDRDRDQYQHEHQVGQSELEQQHIGISYRGNFALFDDASAMIRDDTWSCVIVVLTFWFFVSMTLILGVYGAVSMQLGPNTSILIQPHPLFVQTIRVEELGNTETETGPMLFGLYKSPPLNVVTTWSKTLNVSVPSDSHKEWIYYLNDGSQINISYSVNSPSSSVFLIIAQGNEGLAQWLEDPTYPNTTLLWNVVHGSGVIQQNIFKSSSYYVAVGNLNSEDVEMQLTVRVRAFLYNTSDAYYKCSLSNGGMCSLSVLFPKGNAVVLTSPDPDQGTGIDEWSVKLSYGPRWVTYIVGTGGMTLLMLVCFNFLNKFQCTRQDRTGAQFEEIQSERAPLLYKDDDLSSWGSSCDSASNDEEDFENSLAAGSSEGKPVRDGENSNNTRRLCAICFDAPRDCFFLPCGHCVACFACGTRVAEAAGTCPICRRNLKKVRKIFTV